MEGSKATVLAVDDSEDILGLIGATLGREHRVKLAADGSTALRLAFEEPRPDLILLDVEMPEASGYEVCKTLKASPAVADIPVIFLSGHADPRDVVQGFKLGAVDYLAKPINPPVLAMRVRAHLELIARRNQQDEIIRMRTTQLEQTRLQLIRRLGRVMEYHETSAVGNRVVRLGHYARALAQAAGARPLICDLIMKAAPLHDIGKVGVPAQLLRKAGSLSAPEREQMQRHPGIGAEIIGEHDDQLLKLARTLALTHHERWDGSGYPARLRGADIPWAGRVMAIVDAFESMTTTQFYRAPKTLEQASNEISSAAGRQFDPSMVQAFRKALPEFRHIQQRYRDQLGDMLNLDFTSNLKLALAPSQLEKAEMDARSAQAMRDADAERAQALAQAYERLQKEHELEIAEAARRAAPSDVSDETIRLPREPVAPREAEATPAEAEPETQSLDLTLEPVTAEEKAVDVLLESTAPLELASEPQGVEAVEPQLEAEQAPVDLALEPVAVPEVESETPSVALTLEPIPTEDKAVDVLPEPAVAAESATETPSAAEAALRLQEEEQAAQAALQAQADNERATLGAQQKAAADEALVARAAWRRRAEESLARSAQARAAAEARAAKAASARAAAEIAAVQAAQVRRKAGAEAAEAARRAAAKLEALRTAAAARTAAEAAARLAEEERARAEGATLKIVQELEAAEAQAARAVPERITVRTGPPPALPAPRPPKRPARVVDAYLAIALAVCAAALGYVAHRPSRIVAAAPSPRPSPHAAVAPPPLLDSPAGAPLVLRLDRQLHTAPWIETGPGAGIESQ